MNNTNKPKQNPIAVFIRRVKKWAPFFWRFDGIVFFGGYPYPEREMDGYFQRIRSIDTLFTETWRIHVDNSPWGANNDYWIDQSASNTLVVRIHSKEKFLSHFFILLCVLRCRVIYFHSVLSVFDLGYLFRVPFITKILDIHDVVPEEFLYSEDPAEAEYYSKVEKMAVTHATHLITVTDSMRMHLLEKYGKIIKAKFIILPIFAQISWNLDDKPLINGRPVVVYAGGAHEGLHFRF